MPPAVGGPARLVTGDEEDRGVRGMERRPVQAGSAVPSRFDLAPPRRFLFPAVLLLLADEPGYGYRLVKELEGFRFGATDRPSVYRTLGQLERDGLVVSWSDDATSAQSRRLYRITPEGERALRVWMGVIKEERDLLDAVLRRYASSGGVDAALGRCRGRLGRGAQAPMSPVSPTIEPPPRPLNLLARRPPVVPPADPADLQRGSLRRAGGALGGAGGGPLHRRTADVRRDGAARHHRHAALRGAGLRRRGDAGHDRHPRRRAAVGQRDLRRRAPPAHRRPALPDSSRCTSTAARPAGPRIATASPATSPSTA